MPKFTCWSCDKWEREQKGPHEYHHYCRISRPGFPNIGSACAAFDYEPGSDQEEQDEAQ